MRTVACALCICAAVFAPAGAAAAGGTVVAIQGEVTAAPGGAAPGRALRVGDAVAEGTVVETGADATVKIVFDRAVLSIAGGTRVTLERYLFSEERGVIESVIRLARGLIRSQVEPGLGPGSSFQIETWNTIAGVKGTDFTVETAENAFSACYVFEGSVELKSPSGRTALITAGQMARAEGADGAVTSGPIPPGAAAEKRISIREAPRSAAFTKGARAGALGGAAVAGTAGDAVPPAWEGTNPQVSVVGNQLINPKTLSVPAVPGTGPPAPAPPVPPPAPRGPSVPPERAEGLPF